jgi:uncharacterized protein YbjT (DUF2867 family)
VRILTRNPDAPAAQALAARGAEVAKGDLGLPETLAPAFAGASGVFSLQRPDMDNSNSERRHGFALIDAARKAGVAHIVHSSVCQAGTHESFPRWSEGYWSKSYWTDKWAVEEALRGAGFPSWTILRPSFIMENFKHAKAQYLYPQLKQGVILTPVKPDARIQMIAGDDIGAFAAAAFADPAKYGGKHIEMVGDDLTIVGIADALSRGLDKPVRAQTATPDEVLKAGINPTWTRSQEWINDVRYQVDVSPLAAYGVPMMTFAQWIPRNAAEIVIGG